MDFVLLFSDNNVYRCYWFGECWRCELLMKIHHIYTYNLKVGHFWLVAEKFGLQTIAHRHCRARSWSTVLCHSYYISVQLDLCCLFLSRYRGQSIVFTKLNSRIFNCSIQWTPINNITCIRIWPWVCNAFLEFIDKIFNPKYDTIICVSRGYFIFSQQRDLKFFRQYNI